MDERHLDLCGCDDDLVYRFIKNLIDHKEDYYAVHQDAKVLTLKDYNKGVAVPVHPGAERYFKEMGDSKITMAASCGLA